MSRLLAVLLAGLAGAWLVAPPPAGARELSNESDSPSESHQALTLLGRAARAMYDQPYVGRQYVRVSTPTGNRDVVVEIGNAPRRELVLRMEPNDQAAGGSLVEPSVPEATSLLPALDGRSLSLLEHNYGLRLGGRDVIAGRPAMLVEMRRDGGQLAARFWIDDATTLPLRREVYDRSGRVVRLSRFSSLAVGWSRVAGLAAGPARSSATGRPIGEDELGRMRHVGWLAPGELPGGLGLFDSRMTSVADRPVLHLSYSDGLSTLSLFEQPGRLESRSLTGWSPQTSDGARVWTQPGVPERVSWSAGGRVYTLVSDDRAAIDAAVARLPHAPGPRSVLERIRHGIGRILSWFNPFS